MISHTPTSTLRTWWFFGQGYPSLRSEVRLVIAPVIRFRPFCARRYPWRATRRRTAGLASTLHSRVALLGWLGHVLRMDNSRTARQATHWKLRGYKRKPGRPRKNWVDVIKRDLRQMNLTWEEAEELANDKAEWRRRVAQCSHLDAG